MAVNSIRRCYEVVGRARYKTAGRLLITADGGGSNGSRVRLWKLELQKLADETGLILQVCHYPARDVEVEQNRCVTNTSSEKGGVGLYERWG